MGIVRKFAAALGSMLALILFVAAVGFGSLVVLERKAGDIVSDSMRMQRLALEVDSRLQLARQAERDFTLRVHDLGVENARAAYASEFSQRVGEAGRNVAWLLDMLRYSEQGRNDAQARARLAELNQAIERYADSFQQMVKLAATQGVDGQDFQRAMGMLDSEYLKLSSQVRQVSVAASDGARSAHESIGQSSRYVKYILVFSFLFALLLAASIIWVLNRTVAKNVVRLSDAATELSLGNLEARARIRGRDEFGRLADSINAMARRMTDLVNDLEGRAAEASDRLVEAIDSIPEGFVLYDSNERLVLANRKVRELVGKNMSSFQSGISAEQLLRYNAESGLFVNAMGREEAWVRDRLAEHRNPGPPREEPLSNGRWVQITTYRTARGEVGVIMNDITERKRTTQDLADMNADLEELVRERTKVLVEKAMELRQANRRLMELDELKTSFLSSVSHELRTPLTSLLGFSKIIKRDFSRVFLPLAEEDSDRRLGVRIQSNLDIIGSEGERLTRLINDVLDLSRIESGQEEWRFVEVDLADAVHRAMEAASGLFGAKPSVRLTLRRFEEVPPVHCDPDRLHQVLINLLSNAAKFTDAGEVAIDLYRTPLGMIRISVEDTGRGVAPESLDMIFDKFHQAHQGDTLTEKPSGTGLGLAICRQIVERYDGRIWAESARRQGTVVHVELPLTEPDDKPTVLVVDDDEAVREYLAMSLKRGGYGVRTAHDGRQALEKAAARRPDLITMDILMPGLDGREVIERLRADEALRDVPVLVISMVEEAHTAGGDATLLKPVKGDALIGAVRALLGEGTPTNPVLALDDVTRPEVCTLPSLCGELVTRCSVAEMWAMLDTGFEGTVVVPEGMAGSIDLARLNAPSEVQVLLLPDVTS